ncbi:hypothetical protein [Actinopolyspora erythraea]|nr:hypothetical protein [Actinopolyspora erythraea]
MSQAGPTDHRGCTVFYYVDMSRAETLRRHETRPWANDGHGPEPVYLYDRGDGPSGPCCTKPTSFPVTVDTITEASIAFLRDVKRPVTPQLQHDETVVDHQPPGRKPLVTRGSGCVVP